MKKFKSLQTGKIWTILSALVFVMTCSVAVWAATITNKPAENQENKKFDPRKIEQMGEVLSGTDWDNLMDTLNEWTVPAGAIMAFSPEDGCPEGWEIYEPANGNFLMGTNKTGDIVRGGSRTATLSIENLPAHTHYYKDTVYSESETASQTNNYLHGEYTENNPRFLILQRGQYDIPGNWSPKDNPTIGPIYGNGKGNDVDNYPIYGVRATSSEVCKKEGQFLNIAASTGPNYNSIRGQLGLLNSISTDIDNYCYDGTAKSFSVLNPYVTVLYCKKKGGKVSNPIDAECGDQINTCKDNKFQVINDIESDYSNYWECQGSYGGKDAQCIKCKNGYKQENNKDGKPFCYSESKCGYSNPAPDQGIACYIRDNEGCLAGKYKYKFDNYDKKYLNLEPNSGNHMEFAWKCEGGADTRGVPKTSVCWVCAEGYTSEEPGYGELSSCVQVDDFDEDDDRGVFELQYFKDLELGPIYNYRMSSCKSKYRDTSNSAISIAVGQSWRSHVN